MKKEILQNLIEEYKKSGKKYFSLNKLKEDLFSQEPDFNSETLKKNLSRFKKDNILFSAGRGWYSFLPDILELDTKPIRNIINLLKREFPLLEFNVWSTEQLLSYFHHIPTRFFTFVYAERDYLQTIYERLVEKGKKVILNPSRKEAEKIFNVEKETIVLRTSTTESPVKEYYSQIEMILVELFREKDKLAIMDEWEYNEIFKNITLKSRINISVFVLYNMRLEDSYTCPLMAVFENNCG
ncbi:MAG: hypothetical protein KAW88_06625 [Candidatus Cloacimonetes bacterium]|nr:hypothetical protein [Candidatus Cloacimonadota bacterium]